MDEEEELCSRDMPKALADFGHDWESSSWGVIIGVSRCRSCGLVSSARNFPAANKNSNSK